MRKILLLHCSVHNAEVDCSLTYLYSHLTSHSNFALRHLLKWLLGNRVISRSLLFPYDSDYWLLLDIRPQSHTDDFSPFICTWISHANQLVVPIRVSLMFVVAMALGFLCSEPAKRNVGGIKANSFLFKKSTKLVMC